MANANRWLLIGLFGGSLLTACADSGSSPCTDDSCADDTRDSKDSVVEEDDVEDDEEAPVKTTPPKQSDAGASSAQKDSGAQDSKKGAEAPKDSSQSAAPTGDLPCDIAALLKTGCGDCHGAEPVAPISLVSLADFHAASDGKKVHQVVKERVNVKGKQQMPPPGTDSSLSAEQLATLNAWLDKGAPAGSEKCKAPVDDDKQTTEVNTDGLECFRLVAHGGDFKSKYKVGAAKDAYFDAVFAPPWKGEAYVATIKPVIDNKSVIHHWLLFEDAAPGSPGPLRPGSGAHPAGQLLHGWAPGGDPLDFRTHGDVGIALKQTTYTVEFHYNSSDPSAMDASGVELCLAKKKPANLATLAWLGNDNLLLPSTTWTGTCVPVSQEPIHIIGVSPHMHKTGTHMKSVINRKGGMKETLHDADFNFDFQRSYDKEVTLMPGDTITTECTFSQPMTFGESTNAEMCYLFTMAYPAGALADAGLWGGVAHGGSSCLGM